MEINTSDRLHRLFVVSAALFIVFAAVYMLGCKNDRVVQGPAGDQGPIGLPGASGPQGNPGSSPVITTQPAGNQACLNGGLLILSNGTPIGVVCNGQNGAAGQNLTPITIVQFCAATTTYPSTFSEIGYCIGGQLYGVYSQNDGFESYLPPGTYSSNGINSSCTFTIGQNCSISH